MSGAPTHPLVGQTLAGRYRIEDQLGEGGVGVVFRAEHLALGRFVAVKVLHKGAFSVPSAEARFEREARALAALSHPHIVTVTDFGRDDDITYLAMELVEGKSLREVLDEEKKFSWERALDIAVQILRALSYAHDKGVLHRDLKPANLMVRELQQGGPFVQILDFGMAKLVSGDAREESDPGLTRPGHVAGTPAYMAPELLDSKKASPRSDLYAVGVMLFEMLTGDRPFDGDTPLEIMRGHLAAPIPRLSEHHIEGPFVPAAEQLIARLLAKDPALRFSNAAEVLEAIDGLAGAPETPGRRSRIGFEPTVPATASAEFDRSADTNGPQSSDAPSGQAKRGRSALRTVGILTLVLLVSFAAAALLTPRDVILPHLPRWFPGAGSLAPVPPSSEEDGGVVDATLTEAADAGQLMVFDESVLDGGASSLDTGLLASADAGTGDGQSEDAPGEQDAGAAVAATEIATETTTEPSGPADGRPAPADLLTAPLGRQLSGLRRRARTASRPSHFAGLYEYARAHPEDPRVHLILAHAFVRLGWRGDAITRYQLAAHIDPSARGDESMLRDLIALTADRTHGQRAADAIAEIYGDEARGAVEEAFAVTPTGEADQRRRLSALARRLR